MKFCSFCIKNYFNEQRMNIYMIENKSYLDKPHKESNQIGLQTQNTSNVKFWNIGLLLLGTWSLNFHFTGIILAKYHYNIYIVGTLQFLFFYIFFSIAVFVYVGPCRSFGLHLCHLMIYAIYNSNFHNWFFKNCFFFILCTAEMVLVIQIWLFPVFSGFSKIKIQNVYRYK